MPWQANEAERVGDSRESRLVVAMKRREQELQALRRKQRSDVQSLTRLKSVNRNQKGILDRRAALLKRNQIALRNTRKQVVALLTQQQQRKVKGVRGCRGKRKNHILAAINGDKKINPTFVWLISVEFLITPPLFHTGCETRGGY